MAVARVNRRLVPAAAGALLCALALAPGAARAGTYAVVACDAAPHGNDNSWTASASAAMSADEACPTGLQDTHGIRALAKVEAGLAAPFAAASQTFEAPPGAAIVAMTAHLSMHRKNSYWGVGIAADGKLALGCAANDTSDPCLYPAATARTLEFPQGVRRVAAQTVCGRPDGCLTGPALTGQFPERAGIRLYSTTVKLRDDTTPAVRDTKAGALTNGGWQTGSRAIAYSATDNVGIRLTRLYVDGRLTQDFESPCDFTQRAPCANVPAGRYAVDTKALPDGPHQLRIEAVDTAENVGRLTASFSSDNSAPDAPTALAVDAGEGWRPVNGFRLSWRNPASAAPIVTAHYELCAVAGGACTTGQRSGDGIASIADLAVPAPGDYSARVWLEDAAGNVNPANRSLPVHLRFDDVAPGQAAPVAHERWTAATELDQELGMGLGQLVPVSGIAGYSVTTDGSDPDATIDSTGAVVHLTGLHEGVNTVRARAISGAGVPSPYVGETQVRVDLTPPTATVGGAPADLGWQRVPVTLALRGSDQPELSGLAPSAPGEPVENGGYVEYHVDGGDPQRVGGGAADIVVANDGDHTVSFRAVDAAGNASRDQTVRFRIDRSPPELVAFEPIDPGDPRLVRVAASDALSGVASGAIEIRPAGSGGAWQPLATTRRGAGFEARIDDGALSGFYELRARVTDGAGNEAVGDRRRDGSPAVVDAGALRAATRLTVGVIVAGARTAVPTARVAFGRGATVRGTLARLGGAPVGGAVVEVWTRPALAGAPFRLAGRLRTNPAGGFGYALPPGPSRVVRLRFAGSAVERASQADAGVVVPAAVTIAASRHSVRNGERVRFGGRLLGAPIPAGGKVLDLQAFYRGRWRTFATPRAGRDGRWSYTYRFGATRGRLVYRFRVAVRPESSYPYALGYSPTTAVTVTG